VKTRTIIYWIAGSLAFGLMLYTCALPGDLPADTESVGLPGIYTVNGVDPEGVEYSGTVVIAATDEINRFDVEWIVTGGIHRGIGVRTGTNLQVDWEAISSGGGTGSGIARYTIEQDGRLIGTKTVDGFDLAGTEEIFPGA
jgi:hypothetical protein